MERDQHSASLDRFKGVIGEEELNERGKKLGFCERLRVVTPYRIAVAAFSAFACTTVETLADLHRSFTSLFGGGVAYKPFHNQLRKKDFPRFMRDVASALIGKLAVKILRIKRGAPFSEFGEIVIQDGSSFAVKDNLSKVFPGRFSAISPAAVEVHVTMNLLEGSTQHTTVTADTEGERDHLPDPASMKGKLILADRGYFSLEYLDELMEEEASFIFRAKSSINPVVLSAVTAGGKVLKHFHGKHLNELSLSKQDPIDMEVEWTTPSGDDVSCRLIISWSPKHKVFNYFATNLCGARYSIQDVLAAYRLRWQIELLFKEWKSYANLHSFDTSIAAIAEGLIWAALAAATIKRYLAHITQLITGAEVSTRKVAMCAVHVLLEVFVALVRKSPYRLLLAWRRAIKYLATQARRAHPDRDRKSGRLAIGLEPVYATA